MTTTSLKLPEILKQNIQHIAAESGTTAHAFMLQTLESEVRRRTHRADFLAQAQAAADDIDAGGPVYDLAELHQWVKARINAHGTAVTVKDPEPLNTRTVTVNRRRKAV
jgi:predicted transcriptional regulator